jgi:ribosome-associated heat shock protein Hsp15
MERVRMDKWLWAARFFKTRALAAKACDMGRIESNGVTAKAAREVKVGDRLRVKAEAAEFQIEVLGLSEMRGPAAVAQTLYRESEESKALRAQRAEERRQMVQQGEWLEGRPSKKDRREIARWKGRG